MNADELAKLHQERVEKLVPALKRTVGAFGLSAVKLSKEIMSREIYSIPEDRTARGERRFQRFLKTRRSGAVFGNRKGDRKWVRTGHLRRSERFEVRGSTIEDLEVVVVNDAIYAAERHEAGKSSSDILGHKPRNINPVRESHWRDEMKAQLGLIFTDLVADTVREVLGGGSNG